MSKTVILVNPDRGKPPVSPATLDYLSTALIENGYEPDLLDLSSESDWYCATSEAVAGREVLAVAILQRHLDDGLLSSQTFFLPKSKTLVEYLRSKTKAPVIVMGGAFSIYPEAILKFCRADYGIVGDADDALPALVSAIETGGDPLAIPNVAMIVDKVYRQENTKSADLSRKPYSSRHMMDNTRYQNEGGQVWFETKRGCESQTTYGVDALTAGQTIRLRNPKHVAKEIEALADKGIFCLEALDTEFNRPHDHALKICKAMQALNLQDRVLWFATCSPLDFTAELAHAMEDAGCSGIRFRIDSGDPEQLGRLGREHGPEDVLRTFEACRDVDFLTMYEVVMGGPGETRNTIANTFKLLRQVRADMVTILYGVRVYPNTPLGESVRHNGSLRENYHLRGAIYNNANLLRPVFYVESLLGRGVEEYIEGLIDGDPTYLFPFRKDIEKIYNYNDSSVLIEAVTLHGHRGPEWEVFWRLINNLPPLNKSDLGRAAVAA